MRKSASRVAAVAATALCLATAPAYADQPFFPWGNDLRMVSYVYQTGVVVVRNLHWAAVYFGQQEWHSHCGWSGWSVGVSYQRIEPGQEMVFAVHSDSDLLLCRENFVFNCLSDADSGLRQCGQLLDVEWR